MLHADPSAEYRMIVVGYVAGRVDPLYARAAEFIDHDAVVDLCAGVGQELRDRFDAEPHHHEVALDEPTVLGPDPPYAAPLALKCGHSVLEDQGRSMIPVDPFHHPADLFAQDPKQRYLVAFYGDDVHAQLPERRRYLRTDEAHPHYHRSPPRGDLCTDAIAVVHRAQVVDALQVQARNGKAPVPAAGGDEKLVIRHALPILKFDHLLGSVDLRSSDPEAGFDIVLVVEFGRPDQ